MFSPLAAYAFYSDSLTVYFWRLVAYLRGQEDPDSASQETLVARPIQPRSTFATGTSGGARRMSMLSLESAGKESIHRGLSRRGRQRTFYDEESLSNKA